MHTSIFPILNPTLPDLNMSTSYLLPTPFDHEKKIQKSGGTEVYHRKKQGFLKLCVFCYVSQNPTFEKKISHEFF